MAQTYIVFLRGINVGGTGKLPMADLQALCQRAGLANVRTYIQSGNVICESSLDEAAFLKTLDDALAKRMGKRVPVAVRTADELAAVVAGNPFPEAEPAKVGILFLTTSVGKGFLANASSTTGEEVRLGKREVYIHYPNGMGTSDEAQVARRGRRRHGAQSEYGTKTLGDGA